MRPAAILLSVGLLLAAGSGYLASVALSQAPGEPTRTVTVDVAGPGPQGPPGPPGPAGTFECGAGYTVGVLVLVQQGKGPTAIKTCLRD